MSTVHGKVARIGMSVVLASSLMLGSTFAYAKDQVTYVERDGFPEEDLMMLVDEEIEYADLTDEELAKLIEDVKKERAERAAAEEAARKAEEERIAAEKAAADEAAAKAEAERIAAEEAEKQRQADEAAAQQQQQQQQQAADDGQAATSGASGQGGKADDAKPAAASDGKSDGKAGDPFAAVDGKDGKADGKQDAEPKAGGTASGGKDAKVDDGDAVSTQEDGVDGDATPSQPSKKDGAKSDEGKVASAKMTTASPSADDAEASEGAVPATEGAPASGRSGDLTAGTSPSLLSMPADATLGEVSESASSASADPSADGEAPNDSYVPSYTVNLDGKRHVDLTTEKFIAVIGEPCRYIAGENDLYASVMIAQAILESGSGNSGLSQGPNYNLFGIKGTYKGDGVEMATEEDDGTGAKYGIVAGFRKYPGIYESMEDYADLIVSHPEWYGGVTKSNAKSYRDACAALQGTYATSTTYAASLEVLIETYDLTRFDKPLDYKIKGKVKDPSSPNADADGYRDLEYSDYIALISEATSYLGTDYVWGGASPLTGFDCSGLVQWSYTQKLGINLSRTTYTQQHEGVEVPLDLDELRPGDLLFFNESGKDTHHVAMYLGDGFYVHAPETGDVVKVSSFDEYCPTFAKRVIEFEEVDGKASTAKAGQKADAKAEPDAKSTGAANTVAGAKGISTGTAQAGAQAPQHAQPAGDAKADAVEKADSQQRQPTRSPVMYYQESPQASQKVTAVSVAGELHDGLVGMMRP